MLSAMAVDAPAKTSAAAAPPAMSDLNLRKTVPSQNESTSLPETGTHDEHTVCRL
jgi:hypothetical protein